MPRDDNKTDRILKMIGIIRSHPGGLRRSDIARLLDIDLSTVSRYIRDISRDLPVWEDDGFVKINPDGLVFRMELSIYELVFVHLASRLYLKSLDQDNPFAASCLRKLARVFEQFSPDVSRFLSVTAGDLGAAHAEHCEDDDNYLAVLKSVTAAWILQRKMRIVHHSHRRDEDVSYLFHPYWLEPGSGKTSVYAIGFSEKEDQYRTFKLDRIRSAETIDATFNVRPDFKIETYLGKAWGVWKSDDSPVRVVLRFSREVALRVLENTWHETQSTETLPDGSLIWRVFVAEPREMYPWIRGWGADVEVIEPQSLRDAMQEEAARLSKMYGA